MTERWRAVPGWDGHQVSDLGRVRSIDRTLANGQFCAGTVLSQRRNRKSYWCVHLRDGKRSAFVPVHVLVAAAFHGPRPPGLHVLHEDDDKDQNTPDRLRYGTARENEQEKRNRERDRKGRKNGRKGIGKGYRKGSPRARPVESPGSLESQP